MITLDLPDASAVKQAVYLPALRPFLLRARRAVALRGQVFVLLTSDKQVRRLNRIYRGKNKPTDVLSFPAPELPGKNSNRRQLAVAGDLAVSIETAARQATQFKHPLQIELKILLLHGLLHLAGFDHETDHGEMAAREEELRRRFRLPGMLIARGTTASRVAADGGRR